MVNLSGGRQFFATVASTLVVAILAVWGAASTLPPTGTAARPGPAAAAAPPPATATCVPPAVARADCGRSGTSGSQTPTPGAAAPDAPSTVLKPPGARVGGAHSAATPGDTTGTARPQPAPPPKRPARPASPKPPAPAHVTEAHAATAVTPKTVTADGHTYRIVRVLTMIATAYGQGEPGVGPRTATGTLARVGEVAVDPTVVPLGTWLYITGYHSRYLPAGGLLAHAEDTGGAIRGARVDIYSVAPAQFGVQTVRVDILAPEG